MDNTVIKWSPLLRAAVSDLDRMDLSIRIIQPFFTDPTEELEIKLLLGLLKRLRQTCAISCNNSVPVGMNQTSAETRKH